MFNTGAANGVQAAQICADVDHPVGDRGAIVDHAIEWKAPALGAGCRIERVEGAIGAGGEQHAPDEGGSSSDRVFDATVEGPANLPICRIQRVDHPIEASAIQRVAAGSDWPGAVECGAPQLTASRRIERIQRGADIDVRHAIGHGWGARGLIGLVARKPPPLFARGGVHDM